MNTIHHVTTAIMDAVLTPFEMLGDELALILVSGIFGVLALLLFKQISWQGGIKATKDKIKGHMIAIRIYQNDLGIVFKSVMKVLFRNTQYLGLNFGPILPLFVPFMLIASQLVVRYAFAPLPVVAESESASRLPGRGTMIEVHMKKGREADVRRLSLRMPANFQTLSPLVTNSLDGVALQEVVARASGAGEIELLVDGNPVGTKAIAAGDDVPRHMQPERVSSFWSSWLWPAEPTFPAESPIGSVTFQYPDRDLRMLPGGAFGILLTFFLASIVFGIAILKPLNIQI